MAERVEIGQQASVSWARRFFASLRAIDIINVSYILLIAVLLVVFRENQKRWVHYVLVHIALAVAIVAYVRATHGTKVPVLRLLRDWYTPLLFIYLYEETDLLNQLIVPVYFDALKQRFADLFAGKILWNHRLYLDPLIEHLDWWIFGYQPSLEFHRVVPYRWFVELMYFSYFFYYLLIPILGFRLWLRGRQREFDMFLFAVALNMLACYAWFIAVPVSGPKYFFSEAIGKEFPGYVFSAIMHIIFRYGEIANGAFPSSHVTMATVIVLCAWKFDKRIFALYVPMVAGLCASTVYLQAHYFVDVPTGIVVGVFFFLIAGRVKRWIERRTQCEVSPN
jgi:membrane-associated phospholipid phosphatase